MTTPPWWPGGDTHASRIALSALEHHRYCARQAALIHLDGIFTDNVDTVRGTAAHSHVHQAPARHRTPVPAGGRLLTGVPVWSDRLGLYGICDAVEVTTNAVVPVEYKIGRYVPGGPADIQAAAQAICLTEMQPLPVPHAAVFSYADRRRHTITLTEDLLALVEQTADEVRAILAADRLPTAVADSRCRRCSLRTDCLPELARSVTASTATDLYTPRPLGRWDG
ncbi:CRISPR-associated protein Cas4 [Frankia sp. CNm7]|uniref:CRISPR-associated exonuclease Cas4 n=1 Tax=Frankia nepalensis TaxID=1836974 RepID=A0A937US23_9ACTN|nr:CRISPR-associated protein Cas4 [Frankia nepalensis]MBL7499884.1 CRISPR-associated protein Cas4 [Frankia nepalensis]MBL7512298.1 CRISPR-associated protein Cas4 [Frankia nepalensis]MBL7516979.1 CRISPR-associated protein Cas4 [Frankia nepalensis]MBL7631982.1 CRISPR-associated protein Cas4 [Frankia nepalensis]